MITGERKIIGIFGKVNSGKSTFINNLTKSNASIVSSEEGTTTDPVKVYYEIKNLGKTIIYDTAGFGDKSKLGKVREERSFEILDKCDLCIYIIDLTLNKGKESIDPIDEGFLERVESLQKKVIYIARVNEDFKKDFYLPSLIYRGEEDNYKVFEIIKKILNSDSKKHLLGDLVKEGDRVVLVIPIDDQSPKERIILPQQMVIRSLLDKKALISICGPNQILELKSSLDKIDLIITDSQAFKEVYKIAKDEIKITSFSILFAAFKGDLDYFIESFYKIKDSKNIVIYEGCFHHPGEDDIARVKIPNLIRKKFGDKNFSFTRNRNDLKGNDIAIICGSCTKTSSEVLDLINFAKENGVYMTNFGITIAGLTDILEKVALP